MNLGHIGDAAGIRDLLIGLLGNILGMIDPALADIFNQDPINEELINEEPINEEPINEEPINRRRAVNPVRFAMIILGPTACYIIGVTGTVSIVVVALSTRCG
jgi:hypothetical protein